MATYKTALVTGGAGFIGSHIVDALIKRRIKVFVVDDLSTGSRKNLNPNAKFTKMSITSVKFPAYLRKVKPDIIFHTAAMIDVRESVKDPVSDAQVNVVGTLRMAHEAAQIGVKKIVFSSTGGAMYPKDGRPPYTEDVAPAPISPYGIAKRAGELYLNFAYLMHGMPYVALRYANVYGPRQNSKGDAGVVAIFGSRMLKGQRVHVTGSGKQTRDFVYVGDVVRANMMAMRKNVVGEYNIGTGKETSIRQLFKKMARVTDYDYAAEEQPSAPGEVMRSAIRCTKARKELGWEPKMTLDQGLKKTVLWFKRQQQHK